MRNCECGCGEQVRNRFVKYHHKRLQVGSKNSNWKGGRMMSCEYIQVLDPSNPSRNKNGYIGEHIAIAQRVLGRPLPDRAEVHHANGIKHDNRNANLVICESRAYHKLLHQRMRAYLATGDPTKRQCGYCHAFDDEKNMYVAKDGRKCRHRKCATRYYYERMNKAIAKEGI